MQPHEGLRLIRSTDLDISAHEKIYDPSTQTGRYVHTVYTYDAGTHAVTPFGERVVTIHFDQIEGSTPVFARAASALTEMGLISPPELLAAARNFHITRTATIEGFLPQSRNWGSIYDGFLTGRMMRRLLKNTMNWHYHPDPSDRRFSEFLDRAVAVGLPDTAHIRTNQIGLISAYASLYTEGRSLNVQHAHDEFLGKNPGDSTAKFMILAYSLTDALKRAGYSVHEGSSFADDVRTIYLTEVSNGTRFYNSQILNPPAEPTYKQVLLTPDGMAEVFNLHTGNQVAGHPVSVSPHDGSTPMDRCPYFTQGGVVLLDEDEKTMESSDTYGSYHIVNNFSLHTANS